MPQMAPLWWELLNLFIIFFVLMCSSKIYFMKMSFSKVTFIKGGYFFILKW